MVWGFGKKAKKANVKKQAKIDKPVKKNQAKNTKKREG